jgi:hypothetical protein
MCISSFLIPTSNLPNLKVPVYVASRHNLADFRSAIAKSTMSVGLKRTELEWMVRYQEEYLEKSTITEQHRFEVLKQAAAYEQGKVRS